MGLFSNNKKLCPVCGNPTPRFFATEVDGQAICKQCSGEIDLPDDALKKMDLNDFRQYLADFKENHELWPMFDPTFKYSFGWTSVLIDDKNGLMRLKDNGGGWVIEKKYLKMFRIYEDNNVLFESGDGKLRSYPSNVPERVKNIAPIITQFQFERREYDRKVEQERRINRGSETDEERREREHIATIYRPTFDPPEIFGGFRVELTFSHPYWPSYENKTDAPTFDTSYPSVNRYMDEYNEKVEQLHELAVRLMRMIDPSAPEVRGGNGGAAAYAAENSYEAAGSAAQQAPSGTIPIDAVAEIKKYKELLDMGIITEEEFTAKKRQLLGI